jgi:hypothetical protein
MNTNQIKLTFKNGLSNTKYAGYLKWFKTDVKTYIFTFYDMQSKFQNKVVLPKRTCKIHFITSLNIFSVGGTW